MKDLVGKNFTVLGAGVSGEALALAVAGLGGTVFVSENKYDIPKDRLSLFEKAGVEWELGGNSDRALECDVMLLSSGVSPESSIVKRAYQAAVPLEGEVDFIVPRLNGKVVAVTGTNGKTTTTSLMSHILRTSGWDAFAVGNIGTPLGSVLNDKHDVYVVELSSFQLYWTKRSFFDLAIVTNLAPDHIDWHGSVENYVSAKGNALARRRQGAWAVIQERDINRLKLHEDQSVLPLRLGDVSDNNGIYMYKDDAWIVLDGHPSRMFSYGQVPMVGFHNLENAAMAVGGCFALGCGSCLGGSSLAGYKPPSHRCQFVACIDGVTYIDDSKGTNVASTCTALDSIEGRKVAILGGRGKGESYDSLALSVKRNCRKAILIGEERESIKQALDLAGFGDWVMASGMEEAVNIARSTSVSGDTVLLSPACTSWDMYGSYVERGDHFSRLVLGLLGKKSVS